MMSMAAMISSICSFLACFSFSIFCFILLSWSTCSDISEVASTCFFLSPTRMPSCWMLASSRSLLSLLISASLFLLRSTWACVAPPASSTLSERSSSSLARPPLCFSALVRACLSASSSSSWLSIRPCSSLMAFCSLATITCSSSRRLIASWMSLSFFSIMVSKSFLSLSRSMTTSWVTFRSASIFRLCFSISSRLFFSLSWESSSSSRVTSSFCFTLLRWSTFSISSRLFFSLVGVLQLVQSDLQLLLHLVEVVHLLLGLVQLLAGFGLTLLHVFLLLGQLVDQLVLVSDLVIEVPDGVVPVGLLLLSLLDLHVHVVNVFPEAGQVILKSSFLVNHLISLGLGVSQKLRGLCKLLLLALFLRGGPGEVLLVRGEVALLLLYLVQHGFLVGRHVGDLLIQPISLIDLLVVGGAGDGGLLLQLGDDGLHVLLADESLRPIEQVVPGPVPEEEILF